jgi:energy-coupling factor transporter ATP-binding protein EcfA2
VVVVSYIDVSGLFFGYTNDSLLFRNISLSFRLGEQVAIIGRNGSGKTSLVKLLNGMLKPQKGNISINRESTRDKSIADIATTIGFVFQNPNQMLFMNSVEKELELSLLRLSLGKEEQNKRINKMLSFFDLEKYRETHPRSLSRGEKQKLALATVLIQEPQAIILDEPFSGIDFNQRNNLIDYLRILCDEGKLIILITHDIDSIMENCSRVIALDEGNIIYDLPVDEFLLDETNLRKIGLLPTNYLKMIYQLRSKGLPKEILWKKDFIEFFKQTLEL